MNLYFLLEGRRTEILQRIAGSVDEVKRADVSLETFFVCLDAEEESYDDRYAEVVGLLQKLSPPFHFTVIIQDCCIETWLLGNRPLLRPVTRTAELRELMEFYNVRVRDPEGMPKKEGYETRARFHGDYFKAVLRDRSRGLKEEGLRSTKRRIGIVGERQYFESLIERHEETQHLRSFGHLLSAWRGLGARI